MGKRAERRSRREGVVGDDSICGASTGDSNSLPLGTDAASASEPKIMAATGRESRPRKHSVERFDELVDSSLVSVDEDIVSLVPFKELARELPLSSAVRNAILAEPDALRRAEANAKLEVYSKLVFAEVNSSSLRR